MISKNLIKTLFVSLNISNYYLLTHAVDTICPIPDSIHAWTYFSNSYDNGENYGVWYTLSNQKADAFSFAEYCGSLTDDSNMARIFNQEENDFLTENLLTDVKQAWIGGYYQPVFTKNQTFMGWFWIDQDLKTASVPILFTNWKEGSPRGYNSNKSRQWIAVYGGGANEENGNYPGSWSRVSQRHTKVFPT